MEHYTAAIYILSVETISDGLQQQLYYLHIAAGDVTQHIRNKLLLRRIGLVVVGEAAQEHHIGRIVKKLIGFNIIDPAFKGHQIRRRGLRGGRVERHFDVLQNFPALLVGQRGQELDDVALQKLLSGHVDAVFIDVHDAVYLAGVVLLYKVVAHDVVHKAAVIEKVRYLIFFIGFSLRLLPLRHSLR